MSRGRRGTRAGFTLVELMVVVLILGMVSGIASVSWQMVLPRQRLNSDVRTLSSRIRAARAEAIARNARFELYYDIEEQHYWVKSPYGIDGERAVNEEDFVKLHETDLRDGVTFHSITIDDKTYSDGRCFVRFDPLGTSNDHRVVLYQEQFDRYYTIEVLALTGLIKFHDGIYERPEATDSDFD